MKNTILGSKLGLWLLVLCVLATYIMPVQASAETQDLQLGSKGTVFKAGENYLIEIGRASCRERV